MLKLWPDLKRDFPSFGAIGLAIALLHYYGVHVRGMSGWALPPSFGYLALAALALAIVAICLCAFLLSLCASTDRGGELHYLERVLRHLDTRISVLASCGASALFGYSVALLLLGDRWYAIQFVVSALLLVALAETGANVARCRREGFATSYPFTLLVALVILVVYVRPMRPF
jgi:hypothetical protein